MKAIVWKVSKEIPSKWKPGFTNQVVIFKSIDSENSKQYKLNLDSRFKNDCDRWKVDLQEGNIIDIVINYDTGNVDLFKHHKLVERKQPSLLDCINDEDIKTTKGSELCDCIEKISEQVEIHKKHKEI